MELLSYARNRLKIKPSFVLFDSWYASKQILKRIKDYGWYFLTQLKRGSAPLSPLKKNRKVNSKQIRDNHKYPYWCETGYLTGGLKLLCVKNNKKYYCTNRLTLTRNEVLYHYSHRQSVDEVIKVLKSKLMLKDCQARSSMSQEHHFALCMTAYIVLERESKEKGVTIYKLKRSLNSKRRQVPLPHLKRLKKAA